MKRSTVMVNIVTQTNILRNLVIRETCHTRWPGPQHYGLVQHKYLELLVPVKVDKDLDLQVTGDPCFTLWL